MDAYMHATELVLSSANALSLRIQRIPAFKTAAAFTVVWAFVQLVRMSRKRARTPRLRGPPSPSFLYGVGKMLLETQDAASVYESWAREYGLVYQVSGTLGARKIVLHDPKAIAHFYAKETSTYARPAISKKAIEQISGRGLFWADGENHQRQRKTLTPAFSISVIRRLTPIFFDSAHKAKGAWNALIEASDTGSVLVDVQKWMNHISLDSMGLAGFSHDFGALQGKQSPVSVVFDTFGSSPSASAFNIGLILAAQAFPSLLQLPSRRTRLIWKMHKAMEDILTDLRARTKKELEMGEEERSIIGQLMKSEGADSELYLSTEEAIAQMKALLLAGYDSTSISMTWAVIELSRNPDIQTRLRNELLQHSSDPTYDQLVNGLPYLDAVVHEVLRTHPPVPQIPRVAVEDDVIPLSQPIRTESGELIDNLPIAKGTQVSVQLASVNRSIIFWGDDAKDFKPSRWLEDEQGRNEIPAKAKEIQGHRHLLTFSDGPRICLGRTFALVEFKAVLAVLVKSFVFELRDGPETEIEVVRGLLRRPRVVGEEGYQVPLRVRAYTE